MGLTPEQRTEICRQNGRKSRGPKTEAGKARSSQNALKHGLTAVRRTVPGESPRRYKKLTEKYEKYYKRLRHPAKPQLIWLSIQGTVQAKRAETCHDSVLGSQVKMVDRAFDEEGQRRVDCELDRLREHPAAAIAQLKRYRPGCLEIADRFRRLSNTFQELGYLPDEAMEQALNLLGSKPGYEDLVKNANAYKLALYNGRLKAKLERPKSEPGPAAPPLRRAEDLCLTKLPGFAPEPAVCQDWISQLFAGEVDTAEKQAEDFRNGIDKEHRRRLRDSAKMLPEGDVPRQYLRYGRAADGRLFRAVGRLDELLEKQDQRRGTKGRKLSTEKKDYRGQAVRRETGGQSPTAAPPVGSAGSNPGTPELRKEPNARTDGTNRTGSGTPELRNEPNARTDGTNGPGFRGGLMLGIALLALFVGSLVGGFGGKKTVPVTAPAAAPGVVQEAGTTEAEKTEERVAGGFKTAWWETQKAIQEVAEPVIRKGTDRIEGGHPVGWPRPGKGRVRTTSADREDRTEGGGKRVYIE